MRRVDVNRINNSNSLFQLFDSGLELFVKNLSVSDNNDGMGPRTVRTRSLQLNTSFPVGLPLSQGSLPIALKRREKEIYACSDS